MDRRRRLRGAVYLVMLGAATGGAVLAGGRLGAPPVLHPPAWPAWWQRVGPAVAVFAVARLGVVVLAGYLCLVVVLAGAAAATTRRGRTTSRLWRLVQPLAPAGGWRMALSLFGSTTLVVSLGAVPAGASERPAPTSTPATPATTIGVPILAPAGGPAAAGAPVLAPVTPPSPTTPPATAPAATAPPATAPAGTAPPRTGDKQAPPARATPPTTGPPAVPVPPPDAGHSRAAARPSPPPEAGARSANAGARSANAGAGHDTHPPASPEGPADNARPVWVVRPGDSLWSIAAATVSGHRETSEHSVARYWWRVVEANRPHLPDPADPDLLFAGDVVRLPPL